MRRVLFFVAILALAGCEPGSASRGALSINGSSAEEFLTRDSSRDDSGRNTSEERKRVSEFKIISDILGHDPDAVKEDRTDDFKSEGSER